jgi:hypothetical protein
MQLLPNWNLFCTVLVVLRNIVYCVSQLILLQLRLCILSSFVHLDHICVSLREIMSAKAWFSFAFFLQVLIDTCIVIFSSGLSFSLGRY